MVQLLRLAPKEEKPSFAKEVLKNLPQQLQQIFEVKMRQQAAEAEQQSKMQLLEREYGLKGDLEEKKSKQKFDQESEIEGRDYGVVKNTFGEKFANLWRSQPVGARTELIKNALEATQRGINLEEMLGDFQPQQSIQSQQPIETGMEGEPPEIITKTKDFDKGLTPKERTKRQEGRYSTNLPLYQKSVAARSTYETVSDDINILKDLSPKISALERLNINPVSGDIAIPALASPEAQRYIKTINEFTRTAKDTYGARVTNFDLAQFMKRLPTLANSQEGRRQILEQMDIINKINLAHEKSLQDVIEDHGGIRNIDFDKAEEMARKKSHKEISSLRAEFKNIDKKSNDQFDKHVENFKKTVPKDRVAIRKNDGTIGHIPKDKVKDFLKDKVGEVI